MSSTQMERQGHQPHHHQSAELPSAGGVHEGEHEEKKSVLNKVKAKAKKIKDTLTHHHHHHDGDAHHDHDHDDVGKEMEQAGTEVHGAPTYESKEVRTSDVPGQIGGGHRTETPTAVSSAVGHHPTDAIPEAKIESKEVRSSYVAPGQSTTSTQHDVIMLGGGHGTTKAAAAPSVASHHPTDANPSITPQAGHVLSDYRSFIPEQVGVSKHNGVTFGGGQTHPAGAGGRPSSQAHGYTGAHQTASPLSSGMDRQGHEASDNRSSIPESGAAFGGGRTHHTTTQTGVVGGTPTGPVSQSLGYKGAYEATKPPLSSGISHRKQEASQQRADTSLAPDPLGPRGDNRPDNYQSMAKDPTEREIGVTPILHSLDKMSIFEDKSEKTSVGQQERQTNKDGHSQSSGTGSHDQFEAEKLCYDTSPMERDMGVTREGLSVSSATSLIADKAIQAKNVVASKLGYGGEGEVLAGKASSITDYGKEMASTVYDKVAGFGDALMPKIQEHGTEGPVYDKGVSAKEYITEKVSPREEDKALSEVISEAFHKDLGHEEMKAEPGGKVTISAKVARQLGTKDEKTEDDISSSKSGPRGVVVETLRDTVTSWLGIGGDTGPSYVVYHDLPKEANEGMSGHNQQQQQGKDTDGVPKLK